MQATEQATQKDETQSVGAETEEATALESFDDDSDESESGAEEAASASANPADENDEMVRLRQELAQAREELALERSRRGDDERERFAKAVDQLIREGRLAPAHRSSLLDAGKEARYALALLEPFKAIAPESAVPIRRVARQHADASPPAANGRPAMTADRARQIARAALS